MMSVSLRPSPLRNGSIMSSKSPSLVSQRLCSITQRRISTVVVHADAAPDMAPSDQDGAPAGAHKPRRKLSELVAECNSPDSSSDSSSSSSSSSSSDSDDCDEGKSKAGLQTVWENMGMAEAEGASVAAEPCAGSKAGLQTVWENMGMEEGSAAEPAREQVFDKAAREHMKLEKLVQEEKAQVDAKLEKKADQAHKKAEKKLAKAEQKAEKKAAKLMAKQEGGCDSSDSDSSDSDSESEPVAKTGLQLQ